MKHQKLFLVSFLALMLFSMTACCHWGKCRKECPGMKKQKIGQAICILVPTEGNRASGIARFVHEDKSVRITVDVEGLEPGSEHAIHIHDFGDFSAPDAKSAGGHYNPEGHPHAGPDIEKRHAGDLGNLKAGADGRAHLEITVNNISINSWYNPILGRGLVVHASPDDFKTQPTGNAGPRIAFGIIGVANPGK